MKYAWHENKKKRPQHLVGEDGRTLCQIENIDRRKAKTRPYTILSETPAPSRCICRNCINVDAQRRARGQRSL